MSKKVTFRPDRVYEVTGIWVKNGKMEQLDSYFGEVFPIALGDYGVQPLFSLQPVSVYAGDFEPQVMFVNEWPSIEAFDGFVSDARAQALFPKRDDAVSRLVVSHYTVPNEVTIDLTDGTVVEFGAMWVKPGQEDELQEYYENVIPLAKQFGLEPITPLAAISSYKGDFLPSRAGLNHWGELANFERFAAAAQAHFPRRDAALARLEVTHAAVRLEAAK